MPNQSFHDIPQRSEDPFEQNVLACEYTLDTLVEPETRLPVIPPMIRENFFYIQSYSHSGKAGKNHCTNRKNLESYLMALTVEGEGELYYDGSTYMLKPGDLFFIDCRRLHHYHTISDTGWAYNPIHIQGAHIDTLYNVFEGFHKPVVHLELHSSFIQKLEQLWKITEEDSLYTAIEVNHLLTDLISDLIKINHDGEYQQIPDNIKEIQRYIRQHYGEPLTLDTLSEHIHLTKYHISHEFKRYCGMSIVEYINGIRINEAKLLLGETSLSISEIALNVGFESLNYFYRVFRNQESITPSQYRKTQ